ncbi:hypothetical protein [Vitreoscilla stercoraria]|uniref:hypothetical protein n=1 Tax=Vitreoscilla stercoraria TaxID=61 RepID=UPI0003A4AA2B|nr:hypothetical protein [Vitreoscilla stercoraria]AUZ05337.1 hypothetical protein ADP71_18120 [Vitreoscilla sp. C1]
MSKRTFIALALAVLAGANMGANQHYITPKRFKHQNTYYQRLNKANYRNQRKRK